MLAFDLAATAVGNLTLFDRCQHLGLGPADFTLRLSDVTINNIARQSIFASIDSSVGKFCFSSRQPSFGCLFSVKRLTLANDDLPLTFRYDLGQIRCRTVLTSPSNNCSHQSSNLR